MEERRAWWQTDVIYEIYARSFADADGDGFGDLAGIRAHLDYLSRLGIGALWITPIFPSPMVDGGYDVADYTDIDPLFGSLAEFEALLAEAHARSLRVILDFVPNHTSDRHSWFTASRSSRHDPKRDWYLWRDPAVDGGPPNNWLSEFGGSAWTLDQATGQYYYHAFAPEQPDVNWRNPALRAAMYDALRFWLDRGVDGFRVDVMWHMVKDDQFRDNPPNPDYHPDQGSPYLRLLPAYSVDQPYVHEVVAEMRSVVDEYDERVLIGEIYLPVEQLVDYYGRDGREAQLPFNFHLITTPWDAREIEAVIDRYEGALPPGAWPTWVLGNHDKPRVASRVGSAQARVAALLLLTLRGTPTLYYGDELGLLDVDVPAERVIDVRETNVPGRGLGRDPCRTPMPWDGTPHGGFSRATPWLPVGEENLVRNVAASDEDPGSMLSLHRDLLRLRRDEAALTIGSYRPAPAQGTLLAYRREHAGRELLVICNLGHEEQPFELPAAFRGARVLLAARGDAGGVVGDTNVTVPGDEALILEQGETDVADRR